MGDWETMLNEALPEGESIIYCTLPEGELSREFDSGFGGTEGAPFTAWSQTRVFFPVVYDGSEWVESVPRNPCDEVTYHCGGG